MPNPYIGELQKVQLFNNITYKIRQNKETDFFFLISLDITNDIKQKRTNKIIFKNC